MITDRRQAFNTGFSEAQYQSYIAQLERVCGTEIAFRICETPLFIPAEFEQKLYSTAQDIVAQCMSDRVLAHSDGAFPEGRIFPNETAKPEFLAVDFAVVNEQDGSPGLRLIELQGFPTLFGWQERFGATALEHYQLDGLRHLPAEMTSESYRMHLASAILGDHPPEETVLLEVDPWSQKTLPDFLITRDMLGIPIVDVTTVEKSGRELYYRSEDGRRHCIRRIYNRAILDEIQSRDIAVPFSFEDELDVEWAPHPNWFFRLSKHSIPYLDHPAVPESLFLDQLDELPHQLERWVLKPLHSFAGSGVIVGPRREDIERIPNERRKDFILQERIEYAPILDTPEGGTMVELRAMLLWTEEEPRPVNILVRTGRGKMMGVDYNKNLTWVGTTCCLIEE
ncbi:MAG: hypothetical protein CL946_05910 [Ectothiorhodospiraceae bacterium]|nr:hypothetical protein [Ectothiorhodospiraceae bacterium]